MSPQSIPPIVLASVVLFIGTQNLGVFFRRPRNREHLTFCFACLTIGLYDVASAFLYNATSWTEGARWEKMQLISTVLLCGIAPWFLFDYFFDLLPVHRTLETAAKAFTAISLLLAAAVLANPGGLFWPARVPLEKTILLPWGTTLVYHEVELGLYADVQNLLTLAVLLFLFFYILRVRIRTRGKGTLGALAVMGLVLLSAGADVAVSLGVLPIPYTSEYAFMGFAMLIAQSLTRKVADAAVVQEALRESEARYRSVFQHSAVSLWIEDIADLRALLRGLESRGVTDLASYLRDHPEFVREAVRSIRVVDVNYATLRLYEAGAKENLLGPLDRTLDPDAIPQLADSILSIAQGKEGYERESSVRTLRGRRLDVIVSDYIPRGKGADDRMLVCVTDITARKQAEEKLLAFIQQSTEAIFLTDETGQIVEFNPSAERLFGIGRGEAVGRPLWTMMDRIVPEEHRTQGLAERLERRYREAIGTGTADFLNRPFTGELERPDGSRRHFIQFIFPIRTGKGHMLGSIFHDTTEARRTEEALRLSEERLQQAQKLEAIGTLAGGIAHDFNNLLTAILGHSSFLREELPAGSPFAPDVEAIESSAQRASELTRQILTFSRKDPGVEMRSLDLEAVIGEVVHLLSRTVDKSIAIGTDLSKEPLRIRGNAGQIHQAVLNLCLNACDAMPHGGKLTIATGTEDAQGASGTAQGASGTAQGASGTAQGASGTAQSASGKRVAISVTDTGIGMDKEMQGRIFEPFFTTKEKGRGLGLPMVYGIVHGHGGEVEVRSEPGKGTTFRILLPAIDEPPAKTVRNEPPARGGNETVLVIDDEPQVRRVAARILERAGYTVLQAEDGARGLSIFAQRPGGIDLVILDVSMPAMGGAEVHERLTELDPDVKVILSSGYSDDERISAILSKGVSSYLRKPYTSESVLRTVREALDG